tara:strand:- start:106 stop:798 length:693 start_codon:yes stop_codon:yes gene_type:complete
MSDMKLIMESWRGYTADQQEAIQLVEDIWNNSSSRDLILENEAKLLEEGVANFFRSAYGAAKSTIDQFKTFSEQKLMAFVDAGLKKIDSFVTIMRRFAKQTGNKILSNLFPKYGTRRQKEVIRVLRMPKYLRIGATVLAVLLQKAASLGMQAVLDALSAGSGTTAKVANYITENLEKIKLFFKGLIEFLDPNGIVDMIDNLKIMKDVKDLVDEFKADVTGERFRSAFNEE